LQLASNIAHHTILPGVYELHIKSQVRDISDSGFPGKYNIYLQNSLFRVETTNVVSENFHISSKYYILTGSC
jgi:hypothetical protein